MHSEKKKSIRKTKEKSRMHKNKKKLGIEKSVLLFIVKLMHRVN